jgi:hypothetical protein
MTRGDDSPIRVGEAVRASHIVVAFFSAALGITGALLPLAVWKGGVDTRLSVMKEQLDRMDAKLDRLTESAQSAKTEERQK